MLFEEDDVDVYLLHLVVDYNVIVLYHGRQWFGWVAGVRSPADVVVADVPHQHASTHSKVDVDDTAQEDNDCC